MRERNQTGEKERKKKKNEKKMGEAVKSKNTKYYNHRSKNSHNEKTTLQAFFQSEERL